MGNESRQLSFVKVLMEGIQDMVFVLRVGEDSTFYYAFLNNAVMDTINLNLQSIGQTFQEVHSVERAALLEEQYRKVLMTGKTVTFEDTFITSGGELRNGRSTLTPLVNEAGVLSHIVSITQDITNEKLAELDRDVNKHQLVETQSQYRSLFDDNVDGIISIDLNGYILGGNKTVERIYGYSIDKVLGQNIIELVDREDQERTKQYFYQAINGKLKDYHIRIMHKTGEIIASLIKFIPIYIHHKIIGVYVTVKDMREMEEIVSKYVQGEKIFRIITENVHDVIIMMNHEKEFLYISPSCKEIFGIDPEIINNRTAFFKTISEDMVLLEKRFNQAIIDTESFQLQLRVKHEDQDGWIWAEINGAPVYGNNQSFQYMVITARDITLQKEHENQLEYFAYHDSLTGLPNRRFLRDRLTDELNKLVENETSFAIILLDIDNFKKINDVWGHEIGDTVIREFGKRLMDSIGPKNIAARLGGDEFIVLLPTMETEEQAIAIANKIQLAMKAPWYIQDENIAITASMGIALSSLEGITESSILKNADLAMYEAKRAGENKYKVKRF